MDKNNIAARFKVYVHEEIISEDVDRRFDASAIFFANIGEHYVQIDQSIYLRPGETYTEADVGDDILAHKYRIRFLDAWGQGPQLPIIQEGPKLAIRYMAKNEVTNPGSDL